MHHAIELIIAQPLIAAFDFSRKVYLEHSRRPAVLRVGGAWKGREELEGCDRSFGVLCTGHALSHVIARTTKTTRITKTIGII